MMIMVLSEDSIRNITLFLDLHDILELIKVAKFFNVCFDDIFFYNLAFKTYGKQFWIDALNRPYYVSQPLNNLKEELIRIEKFQISLEKVSMLRWTKRDFYNYWKYDNYKLVYLLNRKFVSN